MSDDVPSMKRLPLPGGSVRPSAPAPSSVPVSQSAGAARAHESESVNDDDWDSPAPASSEHTSASSTAPSPIPESSQRKVETGSVAREPSQPPDSVERPSDPSRTPTVRVSTRPQAIAPAEAGSFDGLKEGLPRGTDDRTTLMGIAPFGASSTPPVRPVSSTPPAPTPAPSSRPYVWPQLPPEVVAAQKALALQAHAEGATRSEEPKEETPKAEVTKQEAVKAAGAQTTPPRNRRVATTDDAAYDASDRSSAPKPTRSRKPKRFIAAAVVLGAAGLWAAFQSSGTKSSNESGSSVAESKAVTQAVPVKTPAPANPPVREAPQQAAPAIELTPPPAPAPQPVSAEHAVQPEHAPAVATQAPTAEEATSSGPTTRVVIRSKTKGAKFYRNGREVGTDEITVDLPAGEKRAFEMGLTGHATRKVVIDGSSTEIELGLRKLEGKPGSLTPSDL